LPPGPNYRSKSAWDEWQLDPILTSVKSTGMRIKDIDYPTIIICGQGSNKGVLFGGIASQIIQHLNSINAEIDVDGHDYQNMDAEAQNEWLERWSGSYLEKYFPGLDEESKSPVDLINLMTTKNPDALIQAEVATQGGYNPCAESFTRKRKRRKRSTSSSQCQPGFIHDKRSGYCYQVAPRDEYSEYCSENDWEALIFNDDAEVTGFRSLVIDGKSAVARALSLQ
jgi:hypothetical protein